MLLLMLRKGVKSLQLTLNEWFDGLEQASVTASAFSQARHRLKHTAFVEINREAVVHVCYADGDHRLHHGFRLLAIDGSTIRLPDFPDVADAFGEIGYTQGEAVAGVHAYGHASVLYDVLNGVALDATLGIAKAYEVDLALGHLAHTRSGDLLLTDRNYTSYRYLATLSRDERDFVSRCSAASFATARALLRGTGPDSQTVTLVCDPAQRATARAEGLPLSLTVRFVRVILPTGGHEVLATSLLDETRYPPAFFLDVYNLRWGVEGFYARLKTRLELENFTGQSAESVRQDFHATVYLTGLESLLIRDAHLRLAEKPTRHAYQVNHAVAFNAIKNRALDLIDRETDFDALAERLTALFLMNPTSVRSERKPPRTQRSLSNRLDYQKRRKKSCF